MASKSGTRWPRAGPGGVLMVWSHSLCELTSHFKSVSVYLILLNYQAFASSSVWFGAWRGMPWLPRVLVDNELGNGRL